MSREPKWLGRLDLVVARAVNPVQRLTGWIQYLVGRLPSNERGKVAAAMLKGTTPVDYEASRATSKDRTTP